MEQLSLFDWSMRHSRLVTLEKNCPMCLLDHNWNPKSYEKLSDIDAYIETFRCMTPGYDEDGTLVEYCDYEHEVYHD